MLPDLYQIYRQVVVPYRSSAFSHLRHLEVTDTPRLLPTVLYSCVKSPNVKLVAYITCCDLICVKLCLLAPVLSNILVLIPMNTSAVILHSACTTAQGLTLLPCTLMLRYSNKEREIGYPL